MYSGSRDSAFTKLGKNLGSYPGFRGSQPQSERALELSTSLMDPKTCLTPPSRQLDEVPALVRRIYAPKHQPVLLHFAKLARNDGRVHSQGTRQLFGAYGFWSVLKPAHQHDARRRHTERLQKGGQNHLVSSEDLP